MIWGIISTACITWFLTYTWCRISHQNRTQKLRRAAEYITCHYLIDTGHHDKTCWASKIWPMFTWRYNDYRTLGDAFQELQQELKY